MENTQTLNDDRVTQTIEPWRLWSGIDDLGPLMKLLNFQVEIPTLTGSNSTLKVGFSRSFQWKPLGFELLQSWDGLYVYTMDIIKKYNLYAQFYKIIF
jgi:hypothetical protein